MGLLQNYKVVTALLYYTQTLTFMGMLYMEYIKTLIQYTIDHKQRIITFFDYVNSKAAGIALLVSVFVAVATFIPKYFSYCHELAIIHYWSLDESCIELFGENIIFQIAYSCVFLLFFSVFSIGFYLIFYGIVHTKPIRSNIFHGLIALVVLYFISCLFYFLFYFYFSPSVHILLLSLLNIAVSFFFFLAKTVLFKTKIHSKTKKPPLYVFLILYPFLLILFFTSSYYSSGWSSAQSQRTFYLLNDTQVVLYETSETFYTARCRISGNKLTIDTHIQGAYPRTGHEVYVQTFDSVSLRN